MEKNESKTATTPAKVGVKLLKGHWHAGEYHKAGETIQVAPLDRDWLIANEVVEDGKA